MLTLLWRKSTLSETLNNKSLFEWLPTKTMKFGEFMEVSLIPDLWVVLRAYLGTGREAKALLKEFGLEEA